ncbi:MAG: hypothetical protein HY644_14720 [Acidobacteria bacterium]|nr:hypothetical protein [Acidobacteriota bacterium]
MKRTIALAVSAVLASATYLAGQRRNFQPPRGNAGGVFQFFLGPPTSGAPFLFGPRVGIVPLQRIPKEVAAVLLAERFLFDGRSPFGAGGSNRSFLFRDPGGPAAFYWGGHPYGMAPDPRIYEDRGFVEEWKNRDPFVTGRGPDFRQSMLLSEGMEEEEVMKRLGSPSERIQLGEREVWKYSGYSLFFEGGKLKEIR